MPRKRQAPAAAADASSSTPRGKRPRRGQHQQDDNDTVADLTARPTLQTRIRNPEGFKPYASTRVYRLLEPGPVILVTTGSLTDGTHNVMTMGFHMVLQHEGPPLLGIYLGPWDASFKLLKQTRECVIAIPSVEMAELAVDIGNVSAEDEEVEEAGGKFSYFGDRGIAALQAGRVKAPLVGGPDVIANVECVVHDDMMVKKYNMWVLRAVKSWYNPSRAPGQGGKMIHHRGDGTFVVDGAVMDLKSRMVKWQVFQD